MSVPTRFLVHLAQAVAAVSLYHAGHPAREAAIDRAYQSLVDLQNETPTPTFTFLGDSTLAGAWPLRALNHWHWSARMVAVGVQRIEFIGRVTRDDLEAFLLELYVRFVDEDVSSAEVRQGRPSNIRYGEVRMKGEQEGDAAGMRPLPTAKLGFTLKEEIDGIRWIHEEIQDQKALHLLEASTIVQSLSLAIHSDQSFLIPLLRLKEYDQYTTTHALNVSVLTMSLAEFLGMAPREVRAFGVAGLLHDLGKVKIPKDILHKPGALSPAERAVMNSHTVEGARLIIESGQNLDVAAVVAYEHHLRIDGGGYPSMMYARPSHPAGALVHVCDVFDALHTDRPYRSAMPTKRALAIISEGAGSDFDAHAANAFVQMMNRFERRISDVDVDDPDIRVAAADEGPDAVYDLDEPDTRVAASATEEPDAVYDLDEPEDDGMTWVDA